MVPAMGPDRLNVSESADLQCEAGRVLAAAAFRSSPAISKLLRGLVEMVVQGGPEAVKESLIGVAVFGRDPNYDTQSDPIVRVTARRLRAKLIEYYHGSGRDSLTPIELASGGYVPRIHYRSNDGSGPMQPQRSAVEPRLGARLAAEAAGQPFRLSGCPSGHQAHPAFSRDGRAVAFSWRAPGDAAEGIYVQSLDADAPSRLSPPGVADFRPVWASDGGHIVFVRQVNGDQFEIRLMPVFGMGDRRLATVHAAAGAIPRVDVSPDGRYAVTSERTDADSPARLVLIDLNSGSCWPVVTGLPWHTSCDEAVFSRDSRSLAFRAATSPLSHDIHILSLFGVGAARRLACGHCQILGLVWDPLDDAIIFSGRRAGSPAGLWRYPLSGSEAVALTPAGHPAEWPAVSGPSRLLAWVHPVMKAGIWSVGLRPGQRHAVQVVESAGVNLCPRYSPDGRALAFCSNRSGSEEIWVSNADGHGLRQLTSLESAAARMPRWSPDGHKLCFHAFRNSLPGVFLVPAAGGEPLSLSPDAGAEAYPDWSACGRFLYFASDRDGGWRIWQTPVTGGAPRRLSAAGGLMAAEGGPDGALCFSKGPGQPGLWSLAGGGGEPELLTSALPPEMWGNWTATRDGVYFLTCHPEAAPPARVQFFDFVSRFVSDVAALPGTPAGADSGLSVSPDGQRLAYAQIDHAAHFIELRSRA